MTTFSTQVVAERLRDIYVSFGRDGERALAGISELYDRDVVFRDPLQTSRGREAFVATNRRIMKRARRVSFQVNDVVVGTDSLFLAWTMTYEPYWSFPIVFEGATHARVLGGLIVEQRDYWDLISSFAQSMPVVRTLYTALAPYLE
jgi:hypothetical protein